MTVDEPSEFNLRVSPTPQPAAMTAEAWDQKHHWLELLEALPETTTDDRRLRLCVVGAAEAAIRIHTDPRTIEAIQLVYAGSDSLKAGFYQPELGRAEHLARSAGRDSRYQDPVDYTVERIAHQIFHRPRTEWYSVVADAAACIDKVYPDLTNLFRCVFGNPFRPVAFDPAWRTSTAVALARTMYESRDFSAMPILADALMEAGCESADILDHCRSDTPHVRGCWVVDLVLGKA